MMRYIKVHTAKSKLKLVPYTRRFHRTRFRYLYHILNRDPEARIAASPYEKLSYQVQEKLLNFNRGFARSAPKALYSRNNPMTRLIQRMQFEEAQHGEISAESREALSAHARQLKSRRDRELKERFPGS